MEWENLDKKRIIAISAFLSIFILGTFLIFTTPSSIKVRYNLTVETEDHEQISFNVYEPVEGDSKKKAIIIGHGIMVNKEMLKGFAIEIATSGFVVVTFDFRGHGLSTGDLDISELKNDVKAIKKYLMSRGNIDSNDFGYIGYSMGGIPGNKIVKDDDDFKLFIGIGTSLTLDYEDTLNRELNILMILAKYDQAFDLEDGKEEIADKLKIDDEDVHVNKLYGSFEDGNATMLYLDDNSDHFTTAYDPDFLREARDWIINTFPEVEPVDEDFYANIRMWILIMQLIGGIFLFFLIIDPLWKVVQKASEPMENFIQKGKESIRNLIQKRKEGKSASKREASEKIQRVSEKSKNKTSKTKIDMDDETIESLSMKTLGFSMLFAIPGILIILLTVFLFLPLSTAGISLALLFGNAFGIFILLWIKGTRKNQSILQTLKEPFIDSKKNLLTQIIFGIILMTIIYLILYLSIGLNYIGLIPSLFKSFWVPIYYFIGFLTFLVFGLLFQTMLQEKFEEGFKNLMKAALLNYGIVMIYTISYILLVCLLLGSFFFVLLLFFAVPMLLLITFISALLYQKTGNILAGTIVNTAIFVMITCALSPFMFGFEFISIFAH